MGFHFLLHEIFPTQGSNLGLPHGRKTLPSVPPRNPKLNSEAKKKKSTELQFQLYKLLKLWAFQANNLKDHLFLLSFFVWYENRKGTDVCLVYLFPFKGLPW